MGCWCCSAGIFQRSRGKHSNSDSSSPRLLRGPQISPPWSDDTIRSVCTCGTGMCGVCLCFEPFSVSRLMAGWASIAWPPPLLVKTKQAIARVTVVENLMLVCAIIYSPTTTAPASALVSLSCCGSGVCTQGERPFCQLKLPGFSWDSKLTR